MSSQNQQTQIKTVDALAEMGCRFITYDVSNGKIRGWWARPEYNAEASENEKRWMLMGNNPQEFYYAAEIARDWFIYPLALRS